MKCSGNNCIKIISQSISAQARTASGLFTFRRDFEHFGRFEVLQECQKKARAIVWSFACRACLKPVSCLKQVHSDKLGFDRFACAFSQFRLDSTCLDAFIEPTSSLRHLFILSWSVLISSFFPARLLARFLASSSIPFFSFLILLAQSASKNDILAVKPFTRILARFFYLCLLAFEARPLHCVAFFFHQLVSILSCRSV